MQTSTAMSLVLLLYAKVAALLLSILTENVSRKIVVYMESKRPPMEKSKAALTKSKLKFLERVAWYANKYDCSIEEAEKRVKERKRLKNLIWVKSRKLRKYVENRDGKKCQFCGCGDNLTLDHIIPVAKNGTAEASNLRLLCQPCNNKKGAK